MPLTFFWFLRRGYTIVWCSCSSYALSSIFHSPTWFLLIEMHSCLMSLAYTEENNVHSFAQTSYHSHIDTTRWHVMWITYFSLCDRVDSRFVPSQWETALLCNDASHCPGTRIESVLCYVRCTSNLFQVYTLHSIFVGTDTPVPIGDYFTWDSNLPPCYILVSHCREIVNSLASGRCGRNFERVISEHISWINFIKLV